MEPTGAACMKASLEAGKVVSLDHVETIADGVAVRTPGDLVFPYVRDNVDEFLAIEDDELVDASWTLWKITKWWWKTRGFCPWRP